MLRRMLRYLVTSAYIVFLRWRVRRCRSLEDLLDVAFNCRLHVLRIAPMQLRDELLELARTLDQERPRSVLEIGTARGGTLFLLCQLAAPDADVVSIDLPRGPFGGGYPTWKKRLYRSFAKSSQAVHLIRSDSQDPDTAKQVREFLNEGIDCLLIDGDHRYEGVRADFEIYSKMVRSGGLIIFHDIRPGDVKCVGEVPRFWAELKENYHSREILSPNVEKNFGLGILQW